MLPVKTDHNFNGAPWLVTHNLLFRPTSDRNDQAPQGRVVNLEASPSLDQTDIVGHSARCPPVITTGPSQDALCSLNTISTSDSDEVILLLIPARSSKKPNRPGTFFNYGASDHRALP